jgi:mxaJ protein
MSSRSPDRRGARLAGFLLVAVSAAALAVVPGSGRAPLRVCADPDNLPFSRQDQSGFENRIAALVARALDADVRYYWWPQRRGFVRNTLDANVCDVIVGIPAGSPGVLTTAPYYRAGYVFAYRPERVQALRSFDDPRLARLRVGVPLIGNDMAASPPGAALARRGMVDNVIGYPPLGSTTVSERMLAALEDGTLDVALLWAPQAAYFAARLPFPVTLAPAFDPQGVAPAAFAMAMAVRKDDTALRDALDVALERAHADIDAVLAEYGVPTGDDARVAATPRTPGAAQ